MLDDKKLTKELINSLSSVTNLKDLELIEIKYLGRNGVINDLLKKIKEIPVGDRKEYGKKINQLKQEIKRLLETKRLELSKKKSDKFFDSTLPGKTYPKGSLHPITYTIEKIASIFQKIGFIRVSYPEVEWEYFAFEVLNMPKDHPARDDFETFFIDAPSDKKMGKVVLTPHTSSGQVREMRRVKTPPIRMVNIVKCYRPNWDITHNPMFYQFEGLCIDRSINIAHLKGTIDYFAKEFFGEDRKIRLRPFHFQFTEPSFEIDVSCGVCGGKGVDCHVCKSGWLELAGAGMVHPEVLRAGGIDPNKYSGWAFGFGPDRCLMMKTGIDNIRILYNGDVRFLEQF
ncbi:phenylalanine--tRNA ligase subunit alpha [Candidatus Roizmanbacteria bacterium CG_4_10_14_0_2_um_filter_36_35]|uniref:Phenylalanine--tRNA ligase alpha subunit n=4 Tax=Candidatus Roizmaniibacteriota TaxID=1752723 RepID=A0A2M7BWA9_9BACT|nr:MAG: phenylalanine--tRNA ligase subunit alpha [Candidatus Roizmanbacteria bacterium CG11_big_fil_rev_8_21_14_0_20_35_14]PIV10847.1 MAG: phenylalanine--tRNA ligase subunit alpha [Candidatus Roizmanbacteria bacterium CG03_land_8_20_14_0_80_35_26]PIZ67245.1 MAG: phenylalanine--tRNA ligase subunit alpha [Candidatus Roizmanbacteria bacterium CG_4_10_14_0_2_um_filter_36_35]PJC31117.1 MAG: phenylalanine--tRNA ligase subunit alpha [Candidatus Roizmanbacteria bacterium CG_4_9_14_0_2_um_filter_36_12]P